MHAMYTQLQSQFAAIKRTLMNMKGSPVIQGFAGKRLDLNEHLNVKELLARLDAIDGGYTSGSGGGGGGSSIVIGVTAHSALTGLDHDDHVQYFLADGTRQLDGDLDITGDILMDTLKSIGLGAALGRILFTSGVHDKVSVRDAEFCAGDGTNQVFIDELGNMKFEGNATVWNDIQFSISTAKVPASNAPTWAVFTANTKKYKFDINDYVDLESQEIIHGYEEGTDVDTHIHLFTNGVDVTDRTVKYEIAFAITNFNGVASETVVSKEFIIPANTADRTHLYLDLAEITGTSILFGADITARFKRIAASGTDPSDDPFISQFGMHVRQDSVGSYEEKSKSLKTWVLNDARSFVTLGLANPDAVTYAAGITSNGFWDAQ